MGFAVIRPAEMMMELGLMVKSKEKWLDDFSTGKLKRPDWEIDLKKRELRVLKQARDAYTTLVEKQNASETI